jgi:hypothetical protein
MSALLIVVFFHQRSGFTGSENSPCQYNFGATYPSLSVSPPTPTGGTAASSSNEAMFDIFKKILFDIKIFKKN